MTANTGRTVSRWTKLLVSDGSQMRSLMIDTLGDVGLEWPEADMTAFLEAVHGVLLEIPNFSLEFGGPLSTDANNNYAVLSAMAGVMTPRSFDVQFGIRHEWEAGEPQFGMTATATSGIIVPKFFITGNGRYTAKLALLAGSSAPAWGTAAETVS